MTDDFDARMAQRMADAGERWRDVHTEPAALNSGVFDATEPPIDIVTSAPRRRRWNGWTAGISSVAAAAVAVLVAVNLQGGGSGNGGTEAIDSGGSGIQGTWVLRNMQNAQGQGLRVVEPATLQFTATTIGGTDACNHIGGNLTIGATSFDLSDGLATTDMACIDRAAGFDDEVALIHEVLNGVVGYKVDGDTLTLTGPDGAKLVYARVTNAGSTTDPRALIGTTWVVTTFGSDGADGTAATPITGPHTIPKIRFENDGTYVGSDGCNSYSGTMTVGTGTIEMSPGGGTAVGCESSMRDQAARFANILSGSVTWSITDSQLTIIKKDVGYLVFAPEANDLPLTVTPTTAPPTGNTSQPDSPPFVGTWALTKVAVVSDMRAAAQSVALTIAEYIPGAAEDLAYPLFTYQLELGCSTLIGRFEFRGSTTLRVLSADDRAHSCPSGTTESPDAPQIRDILSGDVVWWEVDNGELRLTYKTAAPVGFLVFAPAATQPSAGLPDSSSSK